MLPEWLLSYRVVGQEVVPLFLTADDHPWLRVLLDEHQRFFGRPERELWERLREPLPCLAPGRKVKLASHVLGRHLQRPRRGGVTPRRVRAAVFGAAAHSTATAEQVVTRVAAALDLRVAEVWEQLFADLPGERALRGFTKPLSPAELALRANLALAQGLLFRATTVTIDLHGNARVLVRHARRRGLICTVLWAGRPQDARLVMSGPFALFRRTLVYGRALGELVPLCAWCRRVRLQAECVVGGALRRLTLGTADPVFPAPEPRRFDSRLEERFARDFARLAPDWEITREPEPVRAGETLIFPDFGLQHRDYPLRRWLLEIVGFWTPDYLRRKLGRLRDAGLANLILCVNEERGCGGEEVPAGARVVRFRGRVDAAAVLAIVSGESHAAAPTETLHPVG